MVLAWGGSGVHAEVYRWKDSKGQVHFGDRPNAADSRAAKEVVVPRPNLAQGFKGTPSSKAGEPTKAASGGEADDPARPSQAVDHAKPKRAPKPGFAVQSQESCQAKKEAYRASAACFLACGQHIYGRGQNNAGCENCEDQPMPRC